MSYLQAMGMRTDRQTGKPSQRGLAPLLRMPAPPDNLHPSGVRQQTHPPAGVSAMRETHDNVGAAGRGMKQVRERKPQLPDPNSVDAL